MDTGWSPTFPLSRQCNTCPCVTGDELLRMQGEHRSLGTAARDPEQTRRQQKGRGPGRGAIGRGVLSPGEARLFALCEPLHGNPPTWGQAIGLARSAPLQRRLPHPEQRPTRRLDPRDMRRPPPRGREDVPQSRGAAWRALPFAFHQSPPFIRLRSAVRSLSSKCFYKPPVFLPALGRT